LEQKIGGVQIEEEMLSGPSSARSVTTRSNRAEQSIADRSKVATYTERLKIESCIPKLPPSETELLADDVGDRLAKLEQDY